MVIYTFHDVDEGSTVVSMLQEVVRKMCDESSVQAAKDRSLLPHDAIVSYVDLGDGTIQYYFNDEVMGMLEQAKLTITSVRVADYMPTDALKLIATSHYRPRPEVTSSAPAAA